MEMVVNEGGFQRVLLDYPIHKIDTLGQAKVITDIELTIKMFRPETVLVPFPSYNQDHRAVHDAALTAMRPNDKQHFVKRILVYEEADVFGTMATFRPNYFRPLDIDRKVSLYEIYESQIRGHRSADLLRAMSEIRGMQAQLPSAEAFEILRWVE
jgi:LmbE family N-acetylglucosaminyl deacetylase